MKNGQILYISGEFILPNCGLSNYLETLVTSLKMFRPDLKLIVRSNQPLWEAEEYLFDTESSKLNSNDVWEKLLKPFVKSNILPHLPKTLSDKLYKIRSKQYYFTYIRHIVAWWMKKSDSTTILLPHIPLDKSITPYYHALMNKKLIWTVHDLHPFYFPEAWSPESLEMCKAILPVLADKSAHIITHNQFTKHSVIEHLAADEDKISVIRLPHILNVQETESSQKLLGEFELYEKYGIKKPYGLWASSTTISHKNHIRLIKAWKLVQKNYKENLQLVCTGLKEPNWKPIADLLESHKDLSDVIFTGPVPRADLISILKNSHFAVCPTLFEGGGCGPAMEATYAGIPAACSNIPQIVEQYDNRNDFCWFFDPKDVRSISETVLNLLSNYDKAITMAKQAQKWAGESRTWRDVALEYGAVINRYL